MPDDTAERPEHFGNRIVDPAVIDRSRPLLPALAKCIAGLPRGARILDIGCLGFRQIANAERLGRGDLLHSGVDFALPTGGLPPRFEFRGADLSHGPIPFDDDRFDLVVASHVIEHLADPIGFFGECIRVCRPGGRLYIEAPSDRSVRLPSFPFMLSRHLMTSFYDDPTHHSHPWTPQAFYRLANYYGTECTEARYIMSWRRRLLLPFYLPLALAFGWSRAAVDWIWDAVGWSCFAVVVKPTSLRGAPTFSYYIPR